MNANSMTEQVNRLIANRLAAGCELFLPGVGALYVEQRGARRLDSRYVAPPCRLVHFVAQEQGVSLVDEIARAARCEPAKAQEIYDRWLDAVLGERTLTIEGVGELRGNRFDPDPEFDMVLNPQGRTPVKVKNKRGNCILWILLLLLVAAVVGYFAFFAENRQLPKSVRAWWGGQAEPEEPIERVDLATGLLVTPPAAESAAPAADSTKTAAPAQPAAPQPTGEASRPQGSVQAPARFVPGRHYVVYGVFGEPENATRAVAEVAAADGALVCNVYRFNNKLLVSPFESDDLAACQRFVRAHRAQWPDVWTYSAR